MAHNGCLHNSHPPCFQFEAEFAAWLSGFSLGLQVALTVGVAEEACQFEHRDLHWGNLLIRRGGPRRRRLPIQVPHPAAEQLSCS